MRRGEGVSSLYCHYGCHVMWLGERNQPYYVTFVEFSQVYDMVPRRTLFKILRRMGCGSVMLYVLAVMYQLTESMIGSAVVTITMGVRQGSPTSYLFFYHICK